MRISDWSSDVCSSDLRYMSAFEMKPRDTSASARSSSDWARSASACATRIDAARLAACCEIGRASCRERVCQYVYISVVAVALKTKQQMIKKPQCNNEYIDVTCNLHNRERLRSH